MNVILNAEAYLILIKSKKAISCGGFDCKLSSWIAFIMINKYAYYFNVKQKVIIVSTLQLIILPQHFFFPLFHDKLVRDITFFFPTFICITLIYYFPK